MHEYLDLACSFCAVTAKNIVIKQVGQQKIMLAMMQESQDGEIEFEESTENACIVLNNGAPSKDMVLQARSAMTPGLMTALLASAQQMTPEDFAIEAMVRTLCWATYIRCRRMKTAS